MMSGAAEGESGRDEFSGSRGASPRNYWQRRNRKMKKIRISGREIVKDIKEGASTEELMDKYGLSLRSLAKVKIKLLEKGLISGCGLVSSHSKQDRELGPSEFAESEESTTVDLLQDLTEKISLDSKLELSSTDLPAVSRSPTSRETRGRQDARCKSISRGRQDPAAGFCPQCGKERSSASEETCMHCGVVFAKYVQRLREMGVAIWDWAEKTPAR